MKMKKSRFFKKLQNRYRLLHEFHTNKTECNGHPRVCNIELTNICNLRCIMCPYPHMTRSKGMMDYNLFQKIVNELPSEVEFVWLHFFGESFIHKELFKMVDFIKSMGFRVGLSTNITLLTPEKSKNLLKSNLDILILCLEGIDKKSYEKIRVKSNYDEVMKNIDEFLKIKKTVPYSKVLTTLQIIKMKETEGFIDEFVRKWEERGFDGIAVKQMVTWGEQVSLGESISGNTKNNLVSREKCIRPWRDLVFLWDGRVSLCCYDFDGKYILGNIRDQTYDEIWNGQPIQAIRKMMINRQRSKIELCKNCSEGYLAFKYSIEYLLIDWFDKEKQNYGLKKILFLQLLTHFSRLIKKIIR